LPDVLILRAMRNPCTFRLFRSLDHGWGLDLATFQVFQSFTTLMYVSKAIPQAVRKDEHS
jgi:hypothetical protein